MTRIAINGFGRIGRCVTRALFADGGRTWGDIELVAINDLTDPHTLAHLLQFDSVHRTLPEAVSVEGNQLRVGDRSIRVLAERDPAKLPWNELGVDLVMECTGVFRDQAGAGKHIEAGARRVIVSAPGKDLAGTFCVGINTDSFDPETHAILSNASCTTNCLAPIAKVIHETFGIEKGHMVTVHSYTNDQRILDLPHEDPRRARAAALSMIPTSTGAAKAIGLVIPELKGRIDGSAIRVPTPDVSLVCFTAVVQKETTAEDVNAAFANAANGSLKGVLAVEPRPLVSSDFIGNPHSSIVDVAQTQVVGGNLVEVSSWYDNEWGFSSRMLDMTQIACR